MRFIIVTYIILGLMIWCVDSNPTLGIVAYAPVQEAE